MFYVLRKALTMRNVVDEKVRRESRWTSAEATPARKLVAQPVNNAEARVERVLGVSESFENCRFPIPASYRMKD